MLIIESGPCPEAQLDEQCAALVNSGADVACFALAFDCEQSFLPGKPQLSLLALVALHLTGGEVRIRLSVIPRASVLCDEIKVLAGRTPELEALAQRSQAPWFTLGGPMALAPLTINKPWGREVWYTAMEVRGQAGARTSAGQVPLHWLLALAPRRLTAGRERDLILLKRLQPWSHEALGDLYFEVHEHKNEVYLVTRVDEEVWPGGQGAIRLGFNPQKRSRYADDNRFKADYLASVKAYEKVRREIDQHLDAWREVQGLAPLAPLTPAQYDRAVSELDPALAAREQRERALMESFSAMRPVRTGDVIKVPPQTPHGLLHGVELIELHSAHNERKILSFGQKVLTQPHWDTEAALAALSLETPAQHPARSWQLTPGARLELLAEYPDFWVLRLRLTSGESLPYRRLRSFRAHPGGSDDYALLVSISGRVHYGHSPQNPILPGETHLIPAQCNGLTLAASGDTEVLLALPGAPPSLSTVASC